jgi:uncharacterized protein (DUF952 family)
MITHIVKRGEWEEAVRRRSYAPESLRVEGFIHCSTLAQVIETANRFYRGQRDLIVLCIEESRLGAELRYEAAVAPTKARAQSAESSPNLSRGTCTLTRASGASSPVDERARREPQLRATRHPNWGEAAEEVFPHLYGELNVDAVVRVVELPCAADGSFRMPEELRG